MYQGHIVEEIAEYKAHRKLFKLVSYGPVTVITHWWLTNDYNTPQDIETLCFIATE